MKVAFANNYYYLRGGSERVFFEEMNLLRNQGHDIYPFTRKHNQNSISKYEYLYPSEMHYENINLMEKIRASINLIYSLQVKKKFNIFLNIIKPDLIHAHNIYGRLTTAIIDSAKVNKVPILMTLHDYKLICPSYLMLNKNKVCDRCNGMKFYNCFLTKCHKNDFIPSFIYTLESYFNKIFKKYSYISYFICPSMFSLKKHLEAGIPEEKLVYIPNFVKVDDFVPEFIPGNYLLYVGRLSKEKGVMTLLKGIKDIDIKLKIVGDGPMRPNYERFVKENNIVNVEFLGYKSGEELKELYRNSSFLVMPSEWYENAPMTIIECFSYGKPIIGSKIGGIPEMIIDGETGFLFDMGNWKDLNEKIRFFLKNPGLIEKTGRKARERAEKEYSAETHYKRLMEIYNKAI